MEDRAHEQVANMVRTTQLEKDMAESTGSGRWIDIFKGVDLRRTEITVFVWVLQNFSGRSKSLGIPLDDLLTDQEPCLLEIPLMSSNRPVSVSRSHMISDGGHRRFSLAPTSSTCSYYITLVVEQSTSQDSSTAHSIS
jgi:hypothetical protein